MDRSAVKAIVDRHVKSYMDMLGIPNWKIRVAYGPIPGGGETNRVAGQCDRLIDYESALIEIDPEEIDDEKHLLEILRHELFHVVLAPFDLVYNQWVRAIDEETVERHRAYSTWTHAMETTVRALERMWWGCEHYQPKVSQPEKARGRKMAAKKTATKAEVKKAAPTASPATGQPKAAQGKAASKKKA